MTEAQVEAGARALYENINENVRRDMFGGNLLSWNELVAREADDMRPGWGSPETFRRRVRLVLAAAEAAR